MNRTLLLTSYFGRSVIRERIIVVLIVILPVLLVFTGAASAPDRDITLILDDQIITPPAVEISVALYAVTAMVLIASIVSFYLGFNLKHIADRLQQVNYNSSEISLSFILVMFVINLIMTVAISLFSLFWVDVVEFCGYFMGLFLASIIFSTLGLIIAELVDTTTLGLYGILTLAVFDTAFLENPIYSRRYTETWISIMPTHEPIQLILRTFFDTGRHWFSNIGFIIIYELVLFVTYLVISRYNIGLQTH